MISQKTRYALKALVLLAKDAKAGRGNVLISNLAQRGGIPQKFLEAILLELKNHGFLQSKKGKGGGYFLAKDPQQIKVGAIVRILEGSLTLLPCVSQPTYQNCDECQDDQGCGIRTLFKKVSDATAEILDNTSLADIQQLGESELQARVLTYTI